MTKTLVVLGRVCVCVWGGVQMVSEISFMFQIVKQQTDKDIV